MKKVVLMLSLMLSFNVYAKTFYQNCYGAENCMTLEEFANQRIIEKFGENDYSDDWGGDHYSFFYDGCVQSCGVNTSDIYISVSDDGKEMTVYGPKEAGESLSIHGFRVAVEDNAEASSTDINVFDNIESFKFEGNFSDLSSINIPSLKNLTLPDTVGYNESFVVPPTVENLTIGENVPVVSRYSVVVQEDYVLDGSNDYNSESEFGRALKEYLQSHPESYTWECDDFDHVCPKTPSEALERTGDGYTYVETIGTLEIEYNHSILSNTPTKIHCLGDIEKCEANMTAAGYEKGTYNMAQVQSKSTNTIEQNHDGSYTIKDSAGNIIGYKNKRIYTLEEAEKVSKPTGNTFKIRYK